MSNASTEPHRHINRTPLVYQRNPIDTSTELIDTPTKPHRHTNETSSTHQRNLDTSTEPRHINSPSTHQRNLDTSTEPRHINGTSSAYEENFASSLEKRNQGYIVGEWKWELGKE
jgi:hypothetical protein